MWFRHLLLYFLALVFLLFGVYMLRIAYYQQNPLVFLALFFSSSLIILLSAVCLLGLFFRGRYPKEKNED